MRYVALLRGINVSGKNMIKMELLRTAFAAAGFTEVKSYINSGNIGFNSDEKSETALLNKIEKLIFDEFGIAITVMVRSQEALGNIFALDPFSGEYPSHKEMHVLFMNEEMPADKQALLIAQQNENEKFLIRNREIYALLKLGVLDSLLGKSFLEKKLKVSTTGRNWRTMEKLVTL